MRIGRGDLERSGGRNERHRCRRAIGRSRDPFSFSRNVLAAGVLAANLPRRSRPHRFAKAKFFDLAEFFTINLHRPDGCLTPPVHAPSAPQSVASTEVQMRKSAIVVAVAMLAATNFPAFAGKYGCIFRQGISPVQNPCTIDSATPGAGSSCTANYPGGTIIGTCFVISSGAADKLKCYFHSPDKGSGTENADVKFTAAPGFQAGGLTQGAPANLVAAYQENATSPLLQASCEPFRP
jgi:hypothetical protein